MTTTRAVDLVTELEAVGFRLWEEAGRLRFRGPRGLLTPERRAALAAEKQAILDHLRTSGEPVLVARPDERHAPFPLTDIQAAYLLGRSPTFPFGGVGCHGYGELIFPSLEPGRLADAFAGLLNRHDMLRAVISPDGTQRVLAEAPTYAPAVIDLRDASPAEAAAALSGIRAEMDHRVYDPATWPLFDLRQTRAADGDRLHFSIDFLICDFVSIQVLLAELEQLYAGQELAPLTTTYRDYLLATVDDGRGYADDRDYWWNRLDTLPPSPDLPLLPGVTPDATPPGPTRFRRLAADIPPERWRALCERAGRHGVSPSGAVLAAYAEAVGRWSRVPEFTLDVTLLDRRPIAPDVARIVGDFTSILLLEVRTDASATFAARAAAVRDQMWQDLDHRRCGGVEVLRELGRRRGAASALMPVVFTSAVGLGEAPGGAGRLGHGISQTPQVWIDCQNLERDGRLATNWDVREGVLPADVVDDMFAAYTGLLTALADGDDAWLSRTPIDLPEAQRRTRERVNDTAVPEPATLLHEPVIHRARRDPDRIAVAAGGRAWTYREVLSRAHAVQRRLTDAGCGPGDPVAIVMDKGVEQVSGVLGTLLAGGVYVPVDANQPPARQQVIIDDCGARHVLTQSWLAGTDVAQTAVDLLDGDDNPLPPVTRALGDLAYVIYTSGSTGIPKGVMISHRGAGNTIADVNDRYGVTAADRVLGLANLGFDLSVWDIFGTLAAGGTLVLPDAARRADPSHWAALAAEHGVTVWNSVPAQFQMLVDYLRTAPPALRPPLRLVLMSGDWIPVRLPDEGRRLLPDARIVSLGGATEASIWSIAFPVGDIPPEWQSIPYGKPLANQTFHVLDRAGRPCPDRVIGELYIGGTGVALGYLGDEERTRERFVAHPVTGERIYRTGDFGRYRPDGVIEFLGREDLQVKIRGHRIELAEVEAALAGHPSVSAAVALVDGDTPQTRRLVAAVEPVAHPPVPVDTAAVRGTASRVAAEVFDGVDLDAYLHNVRQLDEAGLLAMMSALRASGVFTDRTRAYRAEEVLATAEVADRHRPLVTRWLDVLAEEGVLLREPDGAYRLTGREPELSLTRVWSRIHDRTPGAEHPLLDYFRTAAAHLPALLRGDADPVRLLFPEGRLDVSTRLYEDTLFNRWANRATGAAVRAAAAGITGVGPLRVLEVGAGGGGTTAAVLEALDGVEVDYLCTDLSTFFINAARERFAGRPDIGFAILDLDDDPRMQGYAPGVHDVIVAGDVLHAARNVPATLAHLRRLLAPGGWLVLAEMTREHYQIMTSLQLMERYPDVGEGLFLPAARWAELIVDAGGEMLASLPGGQTLVDKAVAELGMAVLAARFKAGRARVVPAELREHCATVLPRHMVPGDVTVLDAIPVTANGKVDRRQVLREAIRPAVDRPSGGGPASAGPVTDFERRLAALWSEVLSVPTVGRDDDFFVLGGDSLLAAQLVGRMTEELPEIADLFFDQVLRLVLETRTVAAFADSAGTPDAGQPTGEPQPLAMLVPLGGAGPGRCALVADGSGTLDGYAAAIGALRADVRAVGLLPGDEDTYVSLDAAVLPSVLAAAYVQELLADDDAGELRLMGRGFGALVALETARILADGGHPVAAVTLVALGDDGDAGTAMRAASRRAAEAYQAEMYAGDVRVVCAPEDVDAQRGRWAGVCLGELTVIAVPAGAEDEALRHEAAR